jgi:putative membrane protein
LPLPVDTSETADCAFRSNGRAPPVCARASTCLHGLAGRRILSGTWNRYCGPPPIPADWLERWNPDLPLIAAMAAFGILHLLALQRHGEWPQKRRAYGATWLLLALLFVSPFCALSSALFSVRVAHHVLLIAVVAPLAVIALPSRLRSPAISAGALAAIFVVHTFTLWIWHAPSLYDSAMRTPAIFWAMQLSLLGTALALWLAVLSARVPLVVSLAALLGTMTQMGLLGAIITFARRPLYAPHLGVTEPFGLTAFNDQQIAGMIMWVPAVLPYLAAALVLTGLRLGRDALADNAR